MADTTQLIAVERLRPPWVLLRPVDVDSVGFLELQDSIKAHGLLNSLCVRPVGEDYEIVDGMYRYMAAKSLGMRELPCTVKDVSDAEVLALQIQANAIRPETTRTEYARQLRRIRDTSPDMTLMDLSLIVHKNPAWITRQLALLKLLPPIQKMVDRGEIPLASAELLSRVPGGYQTQFIDFAKSMRIDEFRPMLQTWIKRYRAARVMKQSFEYEPGFVASPQLRRLRDIEYECRCSAVANQYLGDATTPLDGWHLALQWVLQLDPTSVQRQYEIVMALRDKALIELEAQDEERKNELVSSMQKMQRGRDVERVDAA